MNETYSGTLRDIASAFIKYPEHLAVLPSTRSNSITLNVRGHRTDQSRLIGGGGANVQSLQTIMTEIAARDRQRIRVTVLEPVFGESEPNEPYRPDPDWNDEKEHRIQDLLAKILNLVTGSDAVITAERKELDKTVFTVACKPLSVEAEGALSILFRAIGKSRGRIISITVKKTDGSPCQR